MDLSEFENRYIVSFRAARAVERDTVSNVPHETFLKRNSSDCHEGAISPFVAGFQGCLVCLILVACILRQLHRFYF